MRYSELACSFETKSLTDDVAMFTGIASTADADAHNDVIEPGAFDPIAKNSHGDPDVLMLRDHDRSHVIGGWKSIVQQGRQVRVEGELVLQVEKARETYALLKKGYLSGLSVGFSADRDNVRFDNYTSKRFIKKATLKECSIVARPANARARVTNVKSEEFADLLCECGLDEHDADILVHEGLDALIESKKDPQKPWGDVNYADPGYQDDKVKRYPIHTERNIRAAWSYINMPRNQRAYSGDQLKRIKARIVAAWRDKIDKDGPPGANDKQDDLIPQFLDLPIEDLRIANEVRGLLTQLKGRCHV